jgi:hypothetical protein
LPGNEKKELPKENATLQNIQDMVFHYKTNNNNKKKHHAFLEITFFSISLLQKNKNHKITQGISSSDRVQGLLP